MFLSQTLITKIIHISVAILWPIYYNQHPPFEKQKKLLISQGPTRDWARLVLSHPDSLVFCVTKVGLTVPRHCDVRDGQRPYKDPGTLHKLACELSRLKSGWAVH